MPTSQILGTSGFKAALGAAKETTFGTVAAPTIYIPFDDHNLSAKNKLITRQSVRKSKGMPLPGVGSVEVSGDINFIADADCVPFILANAMGVDTTTAGASGNYVHTLKLAQPTQALNSLTLQADNGNGSTQQYNGCKIDSIGISCKPDDFLRVKASVIGQDLVQVGTSLTPTFSQLAGFEFAHLGTAAGGVSTFNGVSINIKDFSINLKNGLKPHFASTGGRFLVGIDETTAMVDGSMTVEYVSDAVNYLLWGSTSGPAAGAIAAVPLVLTFVAPTVAGITPTFSITLPKVTISEAVLAPKRNDVISYAVKFQCSESSLGAADDWTIAVTNSQATAYAP